MKSVSCSMSLFLIALAVFTAPAANAQLPAAPATDSKGPFATETAQYQLPATVDPDVLENKATEVWARVYWPKAVAGAPVKKHPLLVFLHGNHGTCGSYRNLTNVNALGLPSGPRSDNSCEYTDEGSCPTGYVVTPNHEGYNYVAENLASWGYVVVSVNANRGITCGGGNSGDWGLILARGRLVLKHLSLWSEWSTTGGAPASIGAPDQFVGAVDLSNVGLMGHSRGGEGVRAALNLYRDPGNIWTSRIPGLDIKAIYEIGAVDGQSTRVLDAPSVAWNQTLPLCDGDVNDLQGRAPFERMMNRFFRKGEAESRPSPKSLTMVWGANHNYFNTEWQTSDSYGCTGSFVQKPLFDESLAGSEAQQSVARQSMTAFFRSHVGSDRVPGLAQNFDTAFAVPQPLTAVATVDRDFMPALELAKVLSVDDFSSPTGVNPAGPKNITSAVIVTHATAMEPSVANISWTQAGTDRFYQSNFAESGKGSDISSFDFLDFRAGRAMSDPDVELATSVDFSVALVSSDAAGADIVSNAVAISPYTHLTGPPNDSADLTQTVRVPVSQFKGIDLTKVRGVRFVFDQTAEARIRLAHVRFGVASDKITIKDSQTLETILAVNNAKAILNGQPVNTMDSKPADTTPPDQILPPASFFFSPFDLPGRNAGALQRGSWMPPRKVRQSASLKGGPAVEVSVTTPNGFPVMDALPVLNIENYLFKISRYPSNGKTYALIFSIPEDQYARLPEIGRAQIQYGVKKPSQVWTLPDFSKAANREKLDAE